MLLSVVTYIVTLVIVNNYGGRLFTSLSTKLLTAIFSLIKAPYSERGDQYANIPGVRVDNENSTLQVNLYAVN